MDLATKALIGDYIMMWALIIYFAGIIAFFMSEVCRRDW